MLMPKEAKPKKKTKDFVFKFQAEARKAVSESIKFQEKFNIIQM